MSPFLWGRSLVIYPSIIRWVLWLGMSCLVVLEVESRLLCYRCSASNTKVTDINSPNIRTLNSYGYSNICGNSWSDTLWFTRPWLATKISWIIIRYTLQKLLVSNYFHKNLKSFCNFAQCRHLYLQLQFLRIKNPRKGWIISFHNFKQKIVDNMFHWTLGFRE